jgi:hypothetical protein
VEDGDGGVMARWNGQAAAGTKQFRSGAAVCLGRRRELGLGLCRHAVQLELPLIWLELSLSVHKRHRLSALKLE